jgi:aminomethyltransferase
MHYTALYDLHIAAGGKMVPFAGYEMPVNYSNGIIKEHLHTRENAGLFDVSHMGQIHVRGENAAALLETLMPIDVIDLASGKQRYGLLLNDQGGVIDDLMVARLTETEFVLVVNAACKDNDFKHLSNKLGDKLDLELDQDSSLLALQGPSAGAVMEQLGQELSGMAFMDYRELDIAGISCKVSRSGYTGEDGFEISMPSDRAVDLAQAILAHDSVMWVGLGARDSLRLEAGLSLYGHEITESTTPVEASLSWAISKVRRSGGDREGGFPGADVILPQIPRSVTRRIVGLMPEGRAPIRDGAIIEDKQGDAIGIVTSGGFSPSLGQPICVGYVDIEHSSEHTPLNAVVRDRRLPISVCRLPFVERRYYRP